MDLQEFDRIYAGVKQSESIEVGCDHPDHEGSRLRTLGKGPARRNVLKNGGRAFICRDCTMKYNNPMAQEGTPRYKLGEINVYCPSCQTTRQMDGTCYYGPLTEPYTQVCGSCSQEGKTISEEQRAKISDALSGRELSEEHRKNISDYMKNNPDGVARGKTNLVPGFSSGWNRGHPTPEDVRRKISEANTGKVRTDEQKLNISEGRKAMLKKTGGFSPEHREKLRQAALRQYERGFNPNSHHKSGWHDSPKVGRVFHRSSYEKHVFIWLDEMETVKSYEVESLRIPYWNPVKKCVCTFVVDMTIQFTDGTKLVVEVKPRSWLTSLVNCAKIEALHEWAERSCISYEVWDEFTIYGHTDTEKKAKQFSDWLEAFLESEEDDREIDEVSAEKLEARRFEARVKAKRHYDSRLSGRITIHCEFCKEDHEVRKVQHDQNVAKNGRYICLKENGQLVGKRPKTHLQKENPHAAEGKKKCLGPCGQILDLVEFGNDKSRKDGKAARCRKCRAANSQQRQSSQRAEANHV